MKRGIFIQGAHRFCTNACVSCPAPVSLPPGSGPRSTDPPARVHLNAWRVPSPISLLPTTLPLSPMSDTEACMPPVGAGMSVRTLVVVSQWKGTGSPLALLYLPMTRPLAFSVLALLRWAPVDKTSGAEAGLLHSTA